jgi:hypothetical protein
MMYTYKQNMEEFFDETDNKTFEKITNGGNISVCLTNCVG